MNLEKATELAIMYGTKIVMGIVVLVVGLFIVKIIVSQFGKILEKRNIDSTLQPFLKGLIGTILKVALFISVLGIIGVKTTSFVAVLGAAGLAVGMALQGSLSNFAGGVLILIFRPINKGNVIQAMGYTGTVKEIGIFCTVLNTPDNKVIFLPNGPLAGGSIVNFSLEDKRRVDWTFGISYDDDLKLAKTTIQDILDSEEKVLKDPSTLVKVGELGDSAVNFTVRAWVNAADFWDVHFNVIEKVKLTFDEKGLSFPFPQQDVNLLKKN